MYTKLNKKLELVQFSYKQMLMNLTIFMVIPNSVSLLQRISPSIGFIGHGENNSAVFATSYCELQQILLVAFMFIL